MANSSAPRSESSKQSLPHVAFAVAALSGVLIAIQGIFNGSFTSAGGGPLLAGWVSYIGTLLTVVLVLLVSGNGPKTVRIFREKGAWWWFAIGIGGVPIVISMSWGIPLVGLAVLSVCSVAGQTVMSLILDRHGVGIPQPIALSARRLLAALTALVGVSLAITSGTGSAKLVIAILACVLVFCAGAILTVQNAGSGAVVAQSGQAMIATFTAAAGGTVVISIILGITWLAGGLEGYSFPPASGWWMYLGGPVGMAITFCTAWAVRRLGTFRLTLAVVAGQMLTAMILDLFTGVGLPAITVVSVAILILATIMVAEPKSRKEPEPASD